MASAYTRTTQTGTKLHYIRFKDLNGKWQDKNSHCATLKAARNLAAAGEERIAKGQPFFVVPKEDEKTFGDLWEAFLKAQHNRSKKDDKSRLKCHLVPKWKDVRISDITVFAIMAWIEEMKAGEAPIDKGEPKPGVKKKAGRKPKTKLEDGTMRHNLNLLSRFFGWAISAELATTNPVRQVPIGKRPRQAAKAASRPWIEDDETLLKLMRGLAPPNDLMLYLGNRSGLRPGETFGLRMSDFGFLDDGVIRSRFSYDGCLKEDKYEEGKVKWVPAPDDCKERMAVWLKMRKLAGAKADDFVFPAEPTFDAAYQRFTDAWKEAADAIGLYFPKLNKKTGEMEMTLMTFYEATRHSFVSRSLSNGATLDETSAAVNHSSPVVTRRYYDHFVRKSYSPGLRTPLVDPKKPLNQR